MSKGGSPLTRQATDSNAKSNPKSSTGQPSSTAARAKAREARKEKDAEGDQAQPREKTREELLLGATIKAADAGRKLLEGHQMVVAGNEYTIPAMITTLFHIAQLTKENTIAEFIRAVAFILDDIDEERMMDKVANKTANLTMFAITDHFEDAKQRTVAALENSTSAAIGQINKHIAHHLVTVAKAASTALQKTATDTTTDAISQMEQSATSAAVKIAEAIAENAGQTQTDRTAERVEDKLGDLLDRMDALENGETCKTDSRLQHITETIEKLEGRMEEKLTKHNQDLATLSARCNSLIDRLNTLPDSPPPPQADINPGPKTFASLAREAATRQVPNQSLGSRTSPDRIQHNKERAYIERSQQQAKQVNVVLQSPDAIREIQPKTETELIERANIAMDFTASDHPEKPPTLKFIHAKFQGKNRVVFEMDSTESASWLRRQHVAKTFASLFHLEANHNPNGYQVVVQNVDVRYQPAAEGATKQVEITNRLPTGTILSSRYLKPEDKRAEGQLSTHLLLTLDQPESANTLIKQGIRLDSHVSTVRKLLMEPIRCANCQAYAAGHLAKDCDQPHDTCAKCAQKHRTNTCKVTNPIFFRCANCDQTGHASYDRRCPKYQDARELYNQWYPGNRFIFFPTSDRSTWLKVGEINPADYANRAPHPLPDKPSDPAPSTPTLPEEVTRDDMLLARAMAPRHPTTTNRASGDPPTATKTTTPATDSRSPPPGKPTPTRNPIQTQISPWNTQKETDHWNAHHFNGELKEFTASGNTIPQTQHNLLLNTYSQCTSPSQGSSKTQRPSPSAHIDEAEEKGSQASTRPPTSLDDHADHHQATFQDATDDDEAAAERDLPIDLNSSDADDAGPVTLGTYRVPKKSMRASLKKKQQLVNKHGIDRWVDETQEGGAAFMAQLEKELAAPRPGRPKPTTAE